MTKQQTAETIHFQNVTLFFDIIPPKDKYYFHTHTLFIATVQKVHYQNSNQSPLEYTLHNQQKRRIFLTSNHHEF